MIRNYFLTALRGWVAHKLFTFINISGLAVGLICAVFIMLFVRDELSYDRWIPDSDNLYRVEVDIVLPDKSTYIFSGAPFPMASAMAEQIPEVKAMTRLIPEDVTVSIGDQQFPERLDAVDPQFFDVIKLPLAEGDPSHVFAQPDSVVISQSIARKYFGTDIGVVGRTINITPACTLGTTCEGALRGVPAIVTGVMRDLPHNTQLATNIVIPNTSSADRWLSPPIKAAWGGLAGYGYVVLAPGANPASVLAKLREIISSSAAPRPGDNRPVTEWIVPRLTPFHDVHLSPNGDNAMGIYGHMSPAGNGTTVYAFAAVGVLILLVACFNFTNLAIARATLRFREISVRKVVGAGRGQIAVQFLGESVLMALAALVFALIAVQLLLPSFDAFLDKPLTFNYLYDWPHLMVVVTVAVVAGLLSGLYPAFVLSNFRPAMALRTSRAQLANTGRFRATLVILQFAVSIALGIAAVVVFAQISYARHVDLGFRKEGVVVIDKANSMPPSTLESFVNALRSNSGITDASAGTDVPIHDGWLGSALVAPVRVPGALSDVQMKMVLVDPNFVATYGAHLLAGRVLSADYSDDISKIGANASNVMINAVSVRELGFSSPAAAIGKTVFRGNTAFTIVGVIGDIKSGGAQHADVGTLYWYVPDRLTTVSIHVRSEYLTDTLAFIDKTWADFAPDVAIRRYFLEDDFNNQFRSDERQGAVFTLFVGIAVFIACLGLFGLAAFTAERRTKEIGVRKAMGARYFDILCLLLWEFSVPVLIANVVAWPIAYLYLRGWLDGYADRISLNPIYFVGAGAVALIIAWATVYIHAQQMARANPIASLRCE